MIITWTSGDKAGVVEDIPMEEAYAAVAAGVAMFGPAKDYSEPAPIVRVKILHGNQTGEFADYPEPAAHSAIASGYAEAVPPPDAGGTPDEPPRVPPGEEIPIGAGQLPDKPPGITDKPPDRPIGGKPEVIAEPHTEALTRGRRPER